ncbi:MAG: GntR family transcriptional regulator [Holophagaceae bacterium]|nr:GntR family transcriptional regulator [Holophagaceae bacterium]
MKILLSNASPNPIYEQILRQVRTQILAGHLKEGEALPSIRKLAQTLQISVITTKRAYDELEREGLIDTVGGKGTFVASPNPEFLREKRVRAVEEHLVKAIAEARSSAIPPKELRRMFDLLLESDHD